VVAHRTASDPQHLCERHRVATETVGEEWRSVVGWEGAYEVSSLGRLRSCRSSRSTKAGMILRPFIDVRGRCQYILRDKPRVKCALGHRLVAFAFLSTDPLRQQVNHKNGNQSDNRVENLEWCTGSENQQHAIHVLGHRAAHTDRHSCAKLNSAQARICRALSRMKATHWQPDMAKSWGVCRGTVSSAAKGINWKKVDRSIPLWEILTHGK